MLSLFILAPFILLVLLNLPSKYQKGKTAVWLAGILCTLQALVVLLHPLLRWSTLPDPLGRFFAFQLSVDALSLIVLFIIGLVGLVSLIVAVCTFSRKQHKFYFVNLLLISLIGMNATVLVRDIFSLYVFVELTAISVFVLMAIEKNKFAIEGTFKYLVLSMLASVFMLASIALFVLLAGDTSFAGVHQAFNVVENSFWLYLAVGLFLCGALIKTGVMPFHGWVPDAYSEAQAAVSVLLAGIVTKASGVYVLLRVFSSVFILSPAIQNVLLLVGAITIVAAALAAFTQENIKRMLSYSSISQVGYIVLALGCGTPLGLMGAVFHFFNHAVFKSLLFVNAASLEKKFESCDLMVVSGLGYHLPVTRATSLVGLLSCAGLPPLSGFWSKLIIVIALFTSGRFAYGAVALLAGVITLAYFLLLEREVFFIKIETSLEDRAVVPFGIKFCEVLLALITLAAGLGFPFILNTWLLPIKEILH